MPTGRRVGIGVVMEGNDRAFEMNINNKCSVFTGEIIEIEHALYILLDKDINRDVLIFTDSRSSVEAILNNRMAAHTPRTILNIRVIKLQERQREEEEDRRKIIFKWIPI